MLPGLFLMTVPVTLLFPPIAVIVLGKAKTQKEDKLSNDRSVMPASQLAGKVLALAAVIYPILYFTFGYYIAWRNPELAAFYGGVDPGSFSAQLSNIVQNDPFIYFFQVLRGLMWIGLAVIIIRTMKGSAWEIGLYVGVLFSILMNNVHLIPQPLMPRSVQISHFIETVSSNFIWGLAIVWLLHRQHYSLRDLFGLESASI